MEDCIKIEELKMFLGTGLKCSRINPLTHDNEVVSLSGLIRDDQAYWVAYNDEIETRNIVHLVNNCKPLVRPLSELTDEQLISAYIKARGVSISDLRVCRHHDKTIDIFISKQGWMDCSVMTIHYPESERIIDYYRVNMLVFYNEIAKCGGDLFNWIGRGLANKLEE